MTSPNVPDRADKVHRFLIERLAQVEHFRGLDRPALETIVLAGRVQRYGKGATLFLEGEPSAGMFVLLEGQVHLHKGSSWRESLILATIEPIIMFNEVAALDGGPNPVTARAAQDCLTWRTSPEGLQDLLQRLPGVTLGFLRVLARRNRLLLDQCENLTRPIIKRLARLLLDLSQGGHRPIDRRRYSLGEIASRIATAPEVVSRTLSLLQAQGDITYDRKQIVVLSPQQLDELACS